MIICDWVQFHNYMNCKLRLWLMSSKFRRNFTEFCGGVLEACKESHYFCPFIYNSKPV